MKNSSLAKKSFIGLAIDPILENRPMEVKVEKVYFCT